MSGATLLVEDAGPVRMLTLNRPEARNALGGSLIGALYEALIEADAAPAVLAVVLTGTDPAFCAGIDLKQAASEGQAYFDRHRAQPCIPQVARMATPVIGAINGATFTGGLELALGCDILIASERAVFADTHASAGIMPGGGMTPRLPALVGPAWARRMSFTGEVIDAATALRIGLVTEITPHGELMARAIGIASAIAAAPPQTMRALKAVYASAAAIVLDPAQAVETAASLAHPADASLIESRRVAVTARNRRQIRRG